MRKTIFKLDWRQIPETSISNKAIRSTRRKATIAGGGIDKHGCFLAGQPGNYITKQADVCFSLTEVSTPCRAPGISTLDPVLCDLLVPATMASTDPRESETQKNDTRGKVPGNAAACVPYDIVSSVHHVDVPIRGLDNCR